MIDLDAEAIQTAAAAALEDTLFSFVALEDTADFVIGMRDHYRALLRGALAARGGSSSTTMVRGWKIGLRRRTVMVCACHNTPLHACPGVAAGRPIIVTSIVDGEALYVERPKVDAEYSMLAFGACASANRVNLTPQRCKAPLAA